MWTPRTPPGRCACMNPPASTPSRRTFRIARRYNRDMTSDAAAPYRLRPYGGEPDLPGISALGQASEDLDQREDRQSVENWRQTLADPQLDTTHNLGLWEDTA